MRSMHRITPSEPKPAASRELSFAEAIKEAIGQEMERDPRVFVLGEDIGKIGGIFAATRGLIEKFGPERLRDTPISEAAIAACASARRSPACGRSPKCRFSTSSRT